MAAGVDVLKKEKEPVLPGVKAVPEAFTHLMEFPDTLLPQARLLAAALGTDGRLLPAWVQAYQKLLSAVPPVFWRRIV